ICSGVIWNILYCVPTEGYGCEEEIEFCDGGVDGFEEDECCGLDILRREVSRCVFLYVVVHGFLLVVAVILCIVVVFVLILTERNVVAHFFDIGDFRIGCRVVGFERLVVVDDRFVPVSFGTYYIVKDMVARKKSSFVTVV
nr:hypothetical protein [Tanacetum cinerariifolium]